LRCMEPLGAVGLRYDGCCAAIHGRRVGTTPYREPLNSTKRCGSRRNEQEEWVTLPSWRRNEV
jgi:hypothetical protein